MLFTHLCSINNYIFSLFKFFFYLHYCSIKSKATFFRRETSIRALISSWGSGIILNGMLLQDYLGFPCLGFVLDADFSNLHNHLPDAFSSNSSSIVGNTLLNPSFFLLIPNH